MKFGPGNPGKPFQKGKSANPGGKPKHERDAIELAQKHGVAAIERLIRVMNNPDDSIARPACNDLLDRAFGKPKQVTDLNVGAPPVRELSDDDLLAILTAAKAQREREGEHSGLH